jgi:cytochrome c2
MRSPRARWLAALGALIAAALGALVAASARRQQRGRLTQREHRTAEREAHLTGELPLRRSDADWWRSGLTAFAAIVVLAVLVGAGLYAAYSMTYAQQRRAAAVAMTGGDPDRAPQIMVRYGCAGCHTIPGILGANGLVGPPLRDVGRRVYVGGILTNTPEHLMGWIANPKQFSPRTAMPITGISPEEARHVAAYLYAAP